MYLIGWFREVWKRLRLSFRRGIHLFVCSWGPKPPLGIPPTPEQKTRIESSHPNLATWSVTGPADSSYNCIAWTLGITDHEVLIGNENRTVSDYDSFYASHGWSVSDNGNRAYKKRKIALYGETQENCSHVSLETHDCGWHEGKLGVSERIMHLPKEWECEREHPPRESPELCKIFRYYEKPDDNANLDLEGQS